MAVISLVLGIIAIVTSIVPAVGFILAFVALIMSIIAMCRKKDKEKNRRIKIAAIVLSIIAFIISLIITGGAIIFTNSTEDILDSTKTALLEDSINNLKISLNLERNILMSDNENVDKKEIEEIYMNILKNNYTNLYELGYRIKVNDDLTAEIIEPTN